MAKSQQIIKMEEKCRNRSKKSQLQSAALLDAMEAASAGARREKEPQRRSLEDARRLGFSPSRGGAVALHLLTSDYTSKP